MQPPNCIKTQMKRKAAEGADIHETKAEPKMFWAIASDCCQQGQPSWRALAHPTKSRKKKQKEAHSQLAIQSDRENGIKGGRGHWQRKDVWSRKKWSQNKKAVEKRQWQREWCKRRY
jgi:hypothetical protein